MPNWCTNVLIVSGPTEDLDAFKDKARGLDDTNRESPLRFNQLFPLPEKIEITESISGGVMPDWYDWRVANWGTKWDINAGDINELYVDKTNWVLKFDTAWGPPVELIKNIDSMFPTLHFGILYVEPGMDFSGVEEFGADNYSKDFPPSIMVPSISTLILNALECYSFESNIIDPSEYSQ